MSAPTASVAGPADRPEIAALRTRVFVEEQGVPPEIEQDAADADGRARAQPGRRRAAWSPPAGCWSRGTGRAASAGWPPTPPSAGGGTAPPCWPSCTGRRSLRGVTEVELHAQVTARGFYERAGYTAVGEEYEEAGIAHVTMRRHALSGRGADVTERSGCAKTRPVRPSE